MQPRSPSEPEGVPSCLSLEQHRPMTPAPESPVATPRSWADAPLAPVPTRNRCPPIKDVWRMLKALRLTGVFFALCILVGELLQAMSEESQQRPPQSAHCFPCTQDSVSRCKREIQNIVFENADKIPDGVYKQLMDALLIKD